MKVRKCEVNIEGEIRIKFKHRDTIDDLEDVLSDSEIKGNVLSLVRYNLEDAIDKIDLELIDCEIKKRIV